MGPAHSDRDRPDVLRAADGVGGDLDALLRAESGARAPVDDRDVHVSARRTGAHLLEHARAVLLRPTGGIAHGLPALHHSVPGLRDRRGPVLTRARPA